MEGKDWENIHSIATVGNGGKFDLDPVDPVDTVDKENEDEDERNLQPILQFRDQWVLRNEAVLQTSVSDCNYL